MNTISTRHTTATIATAAATAVVAALTILSASAPTAANAHRPDPFAGPDTQCVGIDSSAGTVDNVEDIAQRKAQVAQYYVDHAQELHQLAAR